jgi:hypothetical protein
VNENATNFFRDPFAQDDEFGGKDAGTSHEIKDFSIAKDVER